MANIIFSVVAALPLVIKGIDVLLKGHSTFKNLKIGAVEHSFWITLNVGGREFLTTRRTLLAEKNTLFDHFIVSEEEVEELKKKGQEEMKLKNLAKKYSGYETVLKWVAPKSLLKKKRERISIVVVGSAPIANVSSEPAIETLDEVEIMMKVQMEQFEFEKNEEKKKLQRLKLSKVRQLNPNSYRMDRDPEHFRPVLNYLRYGKVLISSDDSIEGVLEEARFFEIQSLVEILTDGKPKTVLNPFGRLQEDILEEEANIVAVLDEEESKSEEKKKKASSEEEKKERK